jgi:hypothetical protein
MRNLLEKVTKSKKPFEEAELQFCNVEDVITTSTFEEPQGDYDGVNFNDDYGKDTQGY